jgi:transposase
MSNEELQKKIRELEQRLAKMEKVNEEVETLIERNRYLEVQNRLLTLLHFGPKSEKWTETDKLNSSLFNEAEDEAFRQSLDPVQQEPEAKKELNKRTKRGVSTTNQLPDDFPSREVIYLLKDHEKICGCGAPLEHIGFDTVKRLDITPAVITIIVEKHEKGACQQCDGIDLDEDDAPAIRRAEGKKHLIPGGIATAGLIAWSLSEKYEFALPFYRQEKRFKHLGVGISRGNLCNWAIKAAESCAPLMSLITKQIKSGSVINADETHIQVLKEKGRKPQNKSWMWLFKGGPPGKQAVLFQYDKGRSAQIPKVFLSDYKGWLQTDYSDIGI